MTTLNVALRGALRLAPRVGFEPTTNRLTAGCSTTELPRNSLACQAWRLLAESARAGQRLAPHAFPRDGRLHSHTRAAESRASQQCFAHWRRLPDQPA